MNTFPHPGTSHRCGLSLDGMRVRDLRVGVSPEMGLEESFGAEGHGASGEGALEGEFSLAVRRVRGPHGVLEKVLLELRAGAEGLVAALILADVGPLVVVDAHVALEAAVGGEGLLADLALEELRWRRASGLL